MQSITQLLRSLYPERGIGDGEGLQDLGVDLTVFRESGLAEGLLRRMGRAGWTDLETSVERSCEGFF